MRPEDVQDVAFDGKEVGEIVMRGNLVMKGYYNDRAATESVVHFAWYARADQSSRKAHVGDYFRSGDLAVRFPDGTFAIQDRAKDLVISGGENVSSLNVENEVSMHPGTLSSVSGSLFLIHSPDVFEVAIVAQPHEKWGETPQ